MTHWRSASEPPGAASDDAAFAHLLAQAQAGDSAAFDALFTRFADPLFRYLSARCGDMHVAEDLASDLWLRVVQHLPRFRARSAPVELAFAAWLYQIARNLLIDQARRPARTEPLPDGLVAPDALLEERVLAAETRAELTQTLSQLTPDQHTVLLLRFMEEHSVADTARLTGKSAGAVKVLQHRALAALARRLGDTRRDEAA